MQFVLMSTILILIVLIVFMLVSIKSVSVNIRDKIRLDTANLFSQEYINHLDDSLHAFENEVKEKIIYKDKLIVQKKQQHAIPEANYLDSDFLKGYYALKERFVFNINECIDIHSEQLRTRDMIATKILNTMQFDVIYKLSQYSKENQMDWFRQSLSDYEFRFICDVYERETTIFEVYQHCKELSDIESKPIVVQVPINFNQQVKHPVIVHYDESIAEGFRIIIYGIVYDYSIQRSELA